MLKNHLILAWRNLFKRKFYSLLNIFGLALGIACAVFLYLFVSFHLSFDSYHKKAATTYRIVHELFFETTLHEKGASIAMYKELAFGIPEITDAAVILNNYTFTVNPSGHSQRFKEDRNVALVSPEWFELFQYNWIKGVPGDLKVPNTIALTQRQAIKYFGHENPIGKVLTFDNKQPVKVVGLISDKPAHTDLKEGMYVSLSSLKNLKPDLTSRFFTDWAWLNSTTNLYLSLKDNAAKEKVEALIAALAKKHMGDNSQYYRFLLQPLADVHFNSQYGGATQKSLLATLTVIGILILLIAIFNYINLSVAQQAKRSVEIGTRKVLGGTFRQLFMQLMTETFLLVCIAMLFAVFLVVLFLPVANETLFANDPLYVISYTHLSVFLAGVFLLLTICSGIYPALKLGRINVFRALKNEAGHWRAGFLRKVLIVLQNSVAQTLILCTIVIVLQVHYLKHTDKGFNRDAVVMVSLPDTSALKSAFLSRRLESLAPVQSFSFCFKAPSSENDRGGSVKYDDRGWEKWPARSAIGDSSYLKTFGLQLIAGKNFRESNTTPEFLINETMVKKLGLKSPEEAIGKLLVAGELNDRKGTIAGVVNDFNTVSLLNPIEPVVITNFPAMHSTVAIKLRSENLQAALTDIENSWKQTYPNEVFEAQFLDDQITKLYRKESLQQKLIWIASGIAIFISSLGLLGLISLITLQRTKEIGIRKVIGASVSQISILLSKDFIILISIAFVIASATASWMMNAWLQSFAYRIEMEWWMFALAGTISILIALLTVSVQTIKSALANPVKSLRTE
jgi:putative ABC transport system permease protein